MSATKTTTSEPSVITESLVSKLFVGPILFVSFLFSLLLVDRKTYSSIFSGSHDSHGYYHSHQRKLAKSEMDQAFQQRSKVIAGMCMLSGIVLAIVLWGMAVGWHVLRRGYQVA
jgi:hypothetical protein